MRPHVHVLDHPLMTASSDQQSLATNMLCLELGPIEAAPPTHC